MQGYTGREVRIIASILFVLLSLARPASADAPPYYEVAGAPAGCSSAYVFPRSAPMMAEGYGQPYTVVAAKLMGVEWGACSRMIPHDGTKPVWVVTIWEPGFRGNTFCSVDGKISDVLVVGDPATTASADVKSKWYDATGLERGHVPSGAPPCPAGAPPEPDPAAIAALHPPEPDAPPAEIEKPAQPSRITVAAQIEAGKSYALGGFAIGGRLGLGWSSRHWWLGGALQVNTWQAVPVVGEWFYQTTAFDPAFWAVWKVDRKAQLRFQGLVGGGPVRYQRAWNNAEQGAVNWTGGFFASTQLTYRIASLGVSVYGPGTDFCDDRDDCSVGMDGQLTLGVLIGR